MKYMKFRTAAKLFTSISFIIAILAAILYTLLTYGNVIPVTFNLLHLAIVGVIEALFLLIALIIFLISCGVKKKELKRLAAAQAAADAEIAALAEAAAAEASALEPKKKGWKALVDLKIDSPKKIAMVAVPAVAVTAGLVVAGAKAKRKRKAKRVLRDLERLLGVK